MYSKDKICRYKGVYKLYSISRSVSGGGGLLLAGKLFSGEIPQVSAESSEKTTLQRQEEALVVDLPTEALQSTPHEKDFTDGIILKEDSFVREYSSAMSLVCMIRQDALCSIEKVYLCEQPEVDALVFFVQNCSQSARRLCLCVI